jgi:Sec-independent protein translocase protein TatA
LDTLAILIVILLIVLIVRGPKTLPQIGAILGRGIREARREVEHLRSSDTPEDPGTPKPG